MRRVSKSLTALLTICAMLFALLPATVFAAAPAMISLNVSAGVFEPAFNPDQDNAKLFVDYKTDNITLTPAADGTISINDQSVPSGSASAPISIQYGYTQIPISIKNDGGTKTYTVTVYRPNVPDL
ncbi:MAG: cadherin-like beta sandwich domain-containing protein, partial [Bacillota bacterium]|nr:cadherin-like beta sandwich domain-containing protein [Bacillota bacterium]